MKTKLINLKFVFLAWLMTGWLWGLAGQVETAEKTVIHYTSVHEGQKIIIDNDYGRIEVQPVNRPHILIIATIRLMHPQEKDLDKAFDQVAPVFEKTDSHTLYIHSKQQGDKNLAGPGPGTYTISYVIQMPETVAMEVRADYGSLKVEKMQAPLTCQMDYGQITAGRLENPDNYIQGDYLDSLYIDFMRGGKISGDYARVHIRFAFDLHLTGDYNHLRFNHLKKLRIQGDHNRMQIHRVKSIRSIGDYSHIDIDRLYDGYFQGDLNTLRIGELMDGAYRLEFIGDYTKAEIHNPFDIPFRLQLRGKFNLRSDLPLHILQDRQAGDERTLKAYYKRSDASYFIKGLGEHYTVELKK